MYYLLTALSLAVSLAMAGIATEVGTKYLARYVVENEITDLGIDAPRNAPPRAHPTTDPGLMVEDRVSKVIPVLVAGVQPSSLLANIDLLDGQMLPPAFQGSQQSPQVELMVASIGPSTEVLQLIDEAGKTGNARGEIESGSGTEEETVAPVAMEKGPLFELARDTPHRRDDGTAFLPIVTQRIFSFEWEIARRTEVPMAVEMTGRVVTDPGTGTSVQAELGGLVQPHNGQFPYIGMRVRKGDPIAILQPTFGVTERAQTEARIQQLTNLVSLTNKQIRRLEDVLFVRYRSNKIEALKVEREGYRRELATLQQALSANQLLRAPADGVISQIGVNAGGMALQGQTIFEVIDAKALWVEAAAYDHSAVEQIRNATALTTDGQTLQLEYSGGGLVLNNHAIPLRFRVLDAPDGLSVGKMVTVVVQQNKMVSGISVPASSVIADGDGRSIVWERVSAETFLPRQVDAVRVAGDMTMVRSGLSDGARIVTQGGSILSQIR